MCGTVCVLVHIPILMGVLFCVCRYVNRLSFAKEKTMCSFKKHLPPKGNYTVAFSILLVLRLFVILFFLRRIGHYTSP